MLASLSRFDDVAARCDRLVGQQQAVAAELVNVQNEVVKLKSDRELYEKVVEVLKKLVEKTTERDLKKVEQFVSMGLHNVITDQTIHCLVRPDEKAGASKVRITGKVGKIEGPFVDSFGGGVWNVASVILRVMTILRMRHRKRLILDEALNNLSSSYQENMSNLLASLVHKLGFKCLLVTHQDRFAEGADRVYKASLKNGELKLDRIK